MLNTGTVKFLSAERVYALVTLDPGQNVFVHFSWMLGDRHEALEVGQRVEYDVAPGRKCDA
jgi:cold shock CspA family protein